MTWATVTAAIDTLVLGLSGMTRSPVVLKASQEPPGHGAGPYGGWFWIEYTDSASEAVAGQRSEHRETAGLLTFAWSMVPDPATRRGEAMDRADAIRNKLANETTAATDLRCNVGGFRMTTTTDGALAYVEIPFTLTGTHTL